MQTLYEINYDYAPTAEHNKEAIRRIRRIAPASLDAMKRACDHRPDFPAWAVRTGILKETEESRHYAANLDLSKKFAGTLAGHFHLVVANYWAAKMNNDPDWRKLEDSYNVAFHYLSEIY